MLWILLDSIYGLDRIVWGIYRSEYFYKQNSEARGFRSVVSTFDRDLLSSTNGPIATKEALVQALSRATGIAAVSFFNKQCLLNIHLLTKKKSGCPLHGILKREFKVATIKVYKRQST